MTTTFDRLRDRLRSVRELIASGERVADATEVLKQRALALGRRQLETEARAELAEVVVMRRGDMLIATPLTSTREVRQVEVVNVPGATDIVVGMFQLRGRTFSLVDIAPFFGTTTPLAHASSTLVAVVSATPGDLGLRIDEVVGPRIIYTDELDEGLGERAIGFVSHVTRDLVHLLDAETLMAAPELRIGARRP